MKTKALLEKLMDAERALQRGDSPAARALLFQAQETVLQVDREMIDIQARLSASPAALYRSVAVAINNRRTFGWQPNPGALRLRVGRFVILIFDIGNFDQRSQP